MHIALLLQDSSSSNPKNRNMDYVGKIHPESKFYSKKPTIPNPYNDLDAFASRRTKDFGRGLQVSTNYLTDRLVIV